MDLAAARVRDWMIASPPVVTPQTSTATALRLLREHHLPALPVCEGGRIQGLVDERALLRLTPSEATTLDVYELREVLDHLTVARVTETPAPAVTPDTPLIKVASLLFHAGRVVAGVLDGPYRAGLLTETALLAAAIGAAPALPSQSGGIAYVGGLPVRALGEGEDSNVAARSGAPPGRAPGNRAPHRSLASARRPAGAAPNGLAALLGPARGGARLEPADLVANRPCLRSPAPFR